MPPGDTVAVLRMLVFNIASLEWRCVGASVFFFRLVGVPLWHFAAFGSGHMSNGSAELWPWWVLDRLGFKASLWNGPAE